MLDKTSKTSTILFLFFLGLFCGMIEVYCYMYTNTDKNLEWGMFANAQSGNIALMFIGLAKKRTENFLYLIPLIGFILGLYANGMIQKKYNNKYLFISEILILSLIIVIGNFIFSNNNRWFGIIIAFLLSMISGMVVVRYRYVGNDKIILTMCNGMLVSAIESLLNFKERKNEFKVIMFVVFSMIVGMVNMAFIFNSMKSSYSFFFCFIPLISLYFFSDNALTSQLNKSSVSKQIQEN